MKRDWTPWLLSLLIGLMLLSLSVLVPVKAAHAGPATAAAISNPAAQTALDDDGDNDLLEHWGDPQYAREERLQLNGLLAGMIAASAAALARRARLERSARHA